MKRTLSILALTTFFLGLIQQASAADIRLGQPGYGGTGCPRGTASATLSPDKKSLSILFDRYYAEAGRSAGKTIDRKTCNVAIPVHVPQGFSISIFKIDYRGFVSVPRGGQAKFNVEYFFAGSRGPSFAKTFRGATEKEYLLTNKIGMGALVWTPCGKSVNLRVNSSILARTNSRRTDVLATVDSADVTAGLIYHVQWRRCRR